MMTFEPKLEILPKNQKALWPCLRPTRDMDMVLYGGTAIALRLGHRQSIDFDFFSSNPLDKALLRERLPFLAGSTPLQDEKNTLSVLTSEGVKVSFFGGLRFGRYGHPQTTADDVLSVASLEDLLATKIKVVHQRSEAKDFIDIAAMLAADVSLEKGLAIAEAMFSPELSPAIALKAMTYFEDGDLPSLSKEIRQKLKEACANVSRLPKAVRLSDSLREELPLRGRLSVKGF